MVIEQTANNTILQQFQLFPDYGDVYNIAWSGANRWLLAGTAAGLVGWNIDDEKVDKLGKDYRWDCKLCCQEY